MVQLRKVTVTQVPVASVITSGAPLSGINFHVISAKKASPMHPRAAPYASSAAACRPRAVFKIPAFFFFAFVLLQQGGARRKSRREREEQSANGGTKKMGKSPRQYANRPTKAKADRVFRPLRSSQGAQMERDGHGRQRRNNAQLPRAAHSQTSRAVIVTGAAPSL